MERDVLEELTRVRLAEHDLSLGEHLVMCTVGYRVTVEPGALVRHVLGASQGEARGEAAQMDLEAALASCLRRGWLRVLDESDFDASGRRTQGRDGSLENEPGFEDCVPGQVDFTPEGYRVHRAVAHAISGEAAGHA